MDVRLREIAGKAAGTYFIVTDNSVTNEILPTSNLRLVPISTTKGILNTVVVFPKGAKDSFKAIFGNRNRREEKMGNFSIKSCLDMLDAGPIAVINLRSFNDDTDIVGIANMGTSIIADEVKTTGYKQVFNTSGFWTPKAKNLIKNFTQENLLNFANIGNSNLSFFVTASNDTTISGLTDQGMENLAETDLTFDEFPALTKFPETLVKDTFVDVWIFHNTFDPASVNTNILYGRFFDQNGQIKQESLQDLANLKSSGFVRKITGTLIPYVKNERDEDISIDVLVNTHYATTGLFCAINEDVLESEDINDLPIINLTGFGYHEDGEIKSENNLLSYRFTDEAPKEVVFPPVNPSDIANYKTAEFIRVTGTIFPNGETSGNVINGILENGIRSNHIIQYVDTDSLETKEAKVVSVETNGTSTMVLPAAIGGTFTLGIGEANNNVLLTPTLTNQVGVTHDLYRKTPTDLMFTKIRSNINLTDVIVDDGVTAGRTYQYAIVSSGPNFSDKATVTKQIVIEEDAVSTEPSNVSYPTVAKTASYTSVLMTLDKEIKADEYLRRLTPEQQPSINLLPTNLVSYVPRPEQFVNGTAARQKEILDVLISPSIIGGLANYDGISYVVDVFKSFIEAGYKYQFGQLRVELDKCNRFVNCLINEPFIEDIEDSTNPLFRDSYQGALNLKDYLSQGGNPDFTTNFLTKFVTGADGCFFFGDDEVEGANTYPLAPKVSENFINKQFPWDVIANTSGVLTLTGIAKNPTDDERIGMKNFRWNPVIKKKTGYVVYGNQTGVLGRSALSEIHNAELLRYIKESLYNISLDENFKKGTYEDLLSLEVEVQSFMDGLALQRALKPNPVVKCNAENNTEEIENAGITLVEVEYFNYKSRDKVVFSLKLN